MKNLGFRVISERTFDIDIAGSKDEQQAIVLHDMELQIPEGVNFDNKLHGSQVEEAFLAAFTSAVDNDAFNRLILAAGVSAREASVLRAMPPIFARQAQSIR